MIAISSANADTSTPFRSDRAFIKGFMKISNYIGLSL